MSDLVHICHNFLRSINVQNLCLHLIWKKWVILCSSQPSTQICACLFYIGHISLVPEFYLFGSGSVLPKILMSAFGPAQHQLVHSIQILPSSAQAPAPTGLRSIIITVGHPAGRPAAIRKCIISKIRPSWAISEVVDICQRMLTFVNIAKLSQSSSPSWAE